MAMLYALDRRAAAPDIRAALDTHDYVLLDRYMASNAAFGAARLHQDARGEFVAWVRSHRNGTVRGAAPARPPAAARPPAVAAERSRTGPNEPTEAATTGSRTTPAVRWPRSTTTWRRRLAGPWHVVDGTTTPDVVKRQRNWQSNRRLPEPRPRFCQSSLVALKSGDPRLYERSFRVRERTFRSDRSADGTLRRPSPAALRGARPGPSPQRAISAWMSRRPMRRGRGHLRRVHPVAGHEPGDLELETVGVLAVQGLRHPVVRRADQRAGRRCSCFPKIGQLR